jgi:hypothetical protein
MPGRRQIDDGEPGMRETGPAISPDAFVIRPAMPQGRDHPPQPRLQLIASRRCPDDKKTANPAHSIVLSMDAQKSANPRRFFSFPPNLSADLDHTMQ